MSDLINRQDAIEALTEANLKNHMDSVEGGQENRSAIRIIMELPSAEPEILACGEGELNVRDMNVGDMISRQALRGAMYHEAFETDTEMQRWDSGCWIRYKLFENVIDNLPSVGGDDDE